MTVERFQAAGRCSSLLGHAQAIAGAGQSAALLELLGRRRDVLGNEFRIGLKSTIGQEHISRPIEHCTANGTLDLDPDAPSRAHRQVCGTRASMQFTAAPYEVVCEFAQRGIGTETFPVHARDRRPWRRKNKLAPTAVADPHVLAALLH